MAFTNKLSSTLVAIFAIYLACPVIWKHSYFIQRHLIFMNYINWQLETNLTHPEMHGIKCSRTFRLDYQDIHGDKIEMGAWHILPKSALAKCKLNPSENRTSIEDRLAFADQRPIVFYIHGSAGTRATNHRLELYAKLADEFDYHVIAFDFRGFADSTNLLPTVEGLTLDSKYAYEWLLKQPNVNLDRLTVWGHSLGTGVATTMISKLPVGLRPRKLILEAPFDRMGSAVRDHPLTAPFKIIPYFEYFFVDPVAATPELNFNSIENIGKLKTTNVLIVHAEDDVILPINLGRGLFEVAKYKLGQSVRLIEISSAHGLGHKFICRHEDTMREIKEFISSPSQ